ncbi:MAG: hypothetical protein FWH00_05080 [Oscillospiraceae bacterium]|nr:hypothetical protein [Oscillospiraceae bacterium]
MPVTWLAFAYQAPAEPSKARVYIWRKLKECGAGYLKQGVAVLPKSPASLAKLRSLAVKTREMGGEAVIAELRFIDAHDEAEMIARFQSRSQDEYRELISEISRLRESIRQKSAQDNRMDGVKRTAKQYRQVRSRDYFKSAAVPDIAAALDELIGDMTRAPDDLARYFAQALDK